MRVYGLGLGRRGYRYRPALVTRKVSGLFPTPTVNLFSGVPYLVLIVAARVSGPCVRTFTGSASATLFPPVARTMRPDDSAFHNGLRHMTIAAKHLTLSNLC